MSYCVIFFNLRVLPICICQYLLSICFPFQIEHSSVAGGTIPSVAQGFQEASGRQVPEIAGLSPLLDDVPPGETASETVPLFVGTPAEHARDFLGGFGVRSQYNKALFSTLLRFRKKNPGVFADVAPLIWYCAEWSSKVEGKSPATFLESRWMIFSSNLFGHGPHHLLNVRSSFGWGYPSGPKKPKNQRRGGLPQRSWCKDGLCAKDDTCLQQEVCARFHFARYYPLVN